MISGRAEGDKCESKESKGIYILCQVRCFLFHTLTGGRDLQLLQNTNVQLQHYHTACNNS
jgi:hypothetical protein